MPSDDDGKSELRMSLINKVLPLPKSRGRKNGFPFFTKLSCNQIATPRCNLEFLRCGAYAFQNNKQKKLALSNANTCTTLMNKRTKAEGSRPTAWKNLLASL